MPSGRSRRSPPTCARKPSSTAPDLIETVASVDEDLLEKFVGDEEIGVDELRTAIRKATIAGDIVPVLATELPPALRSAWLPVHVTLAFLGNAVFALTFATSLIYVLEDNRLKAKRPARRLLQPSLERLDALNHRLLSWGFLLLTLGIVTGAIWAHFAWGRFWSWEAREMWSLITWILYAVLLHGRSIGWRGRRAATLTIVSFAVLFVSFVGVNVFSSGRHGGTFGS